MLNIILVIGLRPQEIADFRSLSRVALKIKSKFSYMQRLVLKYSFQQNHFNKSSEFRLEVMSFFVR